MRGTVEGIFTTSGAGRPMVTLPEATAVARRGLLGDRYHDGIGYYSERPSEGGGREVTLIEAEELAQVMRARSGRPLLLIDIAVPRDIEPGCSDLPGVTLANIDDLPSVGERHSKVRRAEARKAEGVVEEEIQAFAVWLGSLEVVPTVAALREHGDAVVASVLAENSGRLDGLSARDRGRVEAMLRAVANRLLHEPTLRVKQAGAEHRHARMQLLRELFGLEEPAVGAAEDAGAEVRELRRDAG